MAAAKNLKRDFVHLISSSDSEVENQLEKKNQTSFRERQTSSQDLLYFWNGLSRLTPFSFDGLKSHAIAASGQACLRFRDILGPLQHLKVGVLSAMCIDWVWLQHELQQITDMPLYFVTDYDRPRGRPGVSDHPIKYNIYSDFNNFK